MGKKIERIRIERPMLLEQLRSEYPLYFDITDYSFLDLKHPTFAEIEQYTPPGWKIRHYHTIIWKLFENKDFALKVYYVSNSGLLRFVPDPWWNDSRWWTTPDHIIILIYNIIARATSRMCMVCGKKGRRRKEELKKPCLCRDCYVEFYNQKHEYLRAVENMIE